LERERKRVKRRTRGPDRQLVERVEKARQRRERALALLLVRVQPQHRFRPDQPDVQPVRIGTRDRV
jgi:hypothetical protein